MTNTGVLEEKIKRLKKALKEKPEKKSEAEDSLDRRIFRKRLKRLQRRRRILLTGSQRGKQTAKAEEEDHPAAPAAASKPESPAA